MTDGGRPPDARPRAPRRSDLERPGGAEEPSAPRPDRPEVELPSRPAFTPSVGRSVFADTGAVAAVDPGSSAPPSSPSRSAPAPSSAAATRRPPGPQPAASTVVADPDMDVPEIPVRRARPSGPPESGSGDDGRRRVVRASAPWRWVFPVVLVAAALVAYGLFRSGYDLVLASRDGAVEAVVDDPTAPGYRAIVEPTRTSVLFEVSQVNGIEELVGVQMISLDPNGGGAVIVIPPALLAQLPDGTTFDLAVAFDPEDPSAAADGLGHLLGTRFTDDPTVLDDTDMATIFGELAPLSYQLADDLTVEAPDGSQRVLLEAGRLQLEADDLAVVNGVLRPGEVVENRILRQVDLWQAITGALADVPDVDAIFPPAADGLFHAVGVLAAGEVRVQRLPVDLFPPPEGDPFYVVSDPDAITELIAEIVPLPLDPGDGLRVQTALLSGTGDPEVLTGAIAPLVGAGAEISVTGNADLLGQQVTTVEYHRPEALEAATAMAEAIGAASPTFVEQVDPLTSVTVTLGADFVPPVADQADEVDESDEVDDASDASDTEDGGATEATDEVDDDLTLDETTDDPFVD